MNDSSYFIGKKALFIALAFLVSLFILVPSLSAAPSSDKIYSVSSLKDGDVIKTRSNPDVYIIKILPSGKKFKRLILNPDIFNSYGHLSWDNIKTVSYSTLNTFNLSKLVREVDKNGKIKTGKIYMVFPQGDKGIKRYIALSAMQFRSAGGDDDAIYNINAKEASETFYSTGKNITSISELRDLLITYTTTTSNNNVSFSNRYSSQYPLAALVSGTGSGQQKSNINLGLAALGTNTNQQQNKNNNGGGGGSSGGEIESNVADPTRATITFSTRNIPTPTLTPASNKKVMVVDVGVSDRDVTLDRIAFSLKPLSGTDTNLHNTFSKVQVLSGGSVVAQREISSANDYDVVLNSGVISLENLSLNIPKGQSKSLEIYLKINSTISAELSRSWSIAVSQNGIRLVDSDTNTYGNTSALVDSFAVREVMNVVQPVPKVGNFKASVITETAIILSWNEFATATGYEIERCAGATCTNWGNKITISSGSTVAATVTPLTANTQYRLRIRASKTGNKFTAWKTITQYTALLKPTNLAQSSSTNTSITLGWTATTNASGYKIQSCSGASCSNFADAKTVSGGSTVTTTITGLTVNTDYKFKIKALATSPRVDSAYSTEVTGATALAVPPNLAKSAETDTSITLGWSSVTNAGGYKIQSCSGASCTNFADKKTISSGSTVSTSITGLTANTIYKFRIKATHSSRTDSDYSSSYSARTTLGVPVISSPDQVYNGIQLTWDAVSDAENYSIDYCDGSGCTDFAAYGSTHTLTTLSLGSLNADTTYRFRIKANGTSPEINSGWSDILTQNTRLATPTLSIVSGATEDVIETKLVGVSGAADYQFQYCDGASCADFENHSVFGSGGTGNKYKTIDRLDANTIYRVRAYATGSGSQVDSVYTSIIQGRTTLEIPTNFSASSPTDDSISLSWTAVSDADGYKIQNCDGSGCSDFADAKTISSGSTTSATVSSLDANTIYRWKIKATGTSPEVDSAYSSVVDKRTTLAVPGNVAVASPSDTSVYMSWNSVTDADGYKVQTCSGASCTNFADKKTISSGSITTTTVDGLSANTVYKFRIKSTGTSPEVDSDYSSSVEKRTTLGTPSLSSSAQTKTSITLSWSQITDADGYQIQSCTGASCTNFANKKTISSGSTTSTTITGLTVNTAYNFRMKATGTSPEVDSKYSTALAQGTQIAAVTNFTASSATDDSVSFSWTVVTGATGYVIQNCDGASCSDFANAKTISSGSTNTATVDSLTANTLYRWKIKATPASPKADSDYTSIVDKRTTLAVPSLSSSAQTATTITLSWSAITGADGYKIQSCEGASCSNFADKKTISSGSTVTTDITGLTANTTYKFQMKTTGSGSEVDSAYSSILTQNTTLAVPGSFAAAVGSNAGEVDLTWTATTGADGYTIQYCDGSGCIDFADDITISSGSTVSHTVSSLTGSTLYRFRIRATGSGSEINSAWATVVEATPT